jgi:hypothetical protein
MSCWAYLDFVWVITLAAMFTWVLCTLMWWHELPNLPWFCVYDGMSWYVYLGSVYMMALADMCTLVLCMWRHELLCLPWFFECEGMSCCFVYLGFVYEYVMAWAAVFTLVLCMWFTLVLCMWWHEPWCWMVPVAGVAHGWDGEAWLGQAEALLVHLVSLEQAVVVIMVIIPAHNTMILFAEFNSYICIQYDLKLNLDSITLMVQNNSKISTKAICCTVCCSRNFDPLAPQGWKRNRIYFI